MIALFFALVMIVGGGILAVGGFAYAIGALSMKTHPPKEDVYDYPEHL